MLPCPIAMLSRIAVILLTVNVLQPTWAQDLGTPKVTIFAGTESGISKQSRYTAGKPVGVGTDILLSNPFGIEVGKDKTWVTTVDDSCIWQCDSDGENFRRIAGNGTQGYSGDQSAAINAQMKWPHEVRADDGGNLFVADTRNHVIRRIDATNGQIQTIAGNGKPGFAGDGKTGSDVQFDQPHSIVLDGEGAVIVADTKNHRVREIDLQTGVVRTVIGDGKRKLPSDGGKAIEQSVFGPRSLAVDGRSIWLVLREGNSIWRLDRDTGRLHHVAGTGKKGYSGDGGHPLQATFNGPKGIAIDSQGRVLIVDTENHAVRRIDLSANRVTTVLGGNAAKSTKPLKRPHGIAATADGGFLVGDSEFHRVLKWTP